MTVLYLARHGETAPNREGRLLGSRADPGLTEVGRGEAEALGRRFAGREPSAIVTSPLRRCVETAEAIARVVGIDVVEERRIAEIDYGEWEGLPLAEIPPETSAAWRTDPGFRPPGGESLEDVQARVAAWCDEQVDRSGPVIAVTHVAPIKAAVAWVLEAPPSLAWRIWIGLASVTTLRLEADVPVLLGLNDRSHLGSDS
ncbi:MAG: histidine phosphatase family protein [Actinobacteria bacterium]|nr:histidine phosphatase family protein [Actinomycetota bacterium]